MNRKPIAWAGVLVVTLTCSAFAAQAFVGGTVKSLGGTLRLTVSVGSGATARDQSFKLTPGTKVTLDGKPAKIEDLGAGVKVTVSYDKDSNEVATIRATSGKPGEITDPPAKTSKSEKPATTSGSGTKSFKSKKSDAESVTLSNAAAGEWPQFRGPNRDGISTDTGLLREWPSDGPRLAWKADGLGRSFSSVAVAGGRVYTMGKVGNAEEIIALDGRDGRKLWSTPIGRGRGKGGGMPGPRCTPTVDGDLVYGIGIDGDIACVEAATGNLVWKKSFESDFGGRMMSGWGFSESPLIDGDKVICTPGGDRATMVALNKKSGQTIWQAAGGRANGAGYASPVVAEVGGVRQYLTLVGAGLISVASRDGKVLWTYDKIANGTANCPTPVVINDLVFCSTGYDTGAALLKISGRGGDSRADEQYFLRARDFQNHHGGFVVVDGHVYGGSGNNNGLPTCLDLRSGKAAWGPSRGPGSGSASVCYADGHVYFRYEGGDVALIEATPSRMNVKSTFRPPVSTPSWSHPAVTGGRLYIRDQEQLLCYDVKGS
jgi:prepilin-type processing-associated H-X9-DG protein